MAHREALRDFQQRLAQRLQAVPVPGEHTVWLAVEAGAGRYLIPLTQAGEIFPARTPLPVPYTQPWFLGLASLRGGLYSVIDLASLVADFTEGPRRPRAANADDPFVTLNPALDVPCALRIDRLAGLRGPHAYPVVMPPPAGAPAWFGPVHQEADGLPWQALDLQALSQHPRFLRISA